MYRPSVHPVASDYGDEDKYGCKAALVGLGYDWYTGTDPFMGIVLNPWDWGYEMQQVDIAAAAVEQAVEEAAEDERWRRALAGYFSPRPLDPVKEEEDEEAEEDDGYVFQRYRDLYRDEEAETEDANPFRPYSWQTGEAPVGGFGAVGAYGWEDGEDVYMGLLLYPGEDGYEMQQAAIAAGAAAKAAAGGGGGGGKGKKD
jgi:hypothetical protein